MMKDFEQTTASVAEQPTDLEYRNQLAVVAAALTTRGVMDEIELVVKPEMFSHPDLQLVYSALHNLYHEGKEIDAFTVEREMARLDGKRFEELGGVAFLQDGLMAVRDGRNAAVYADEVKRFYILHRFSALCRDLMMKATPYEADVQELLAEADEKLLEVCQEMITGTPVKSLSELVEESLERMRNRLRPDYFNPRVQSGFTEYDYLTGGFMPGELTVCAARPSEGKTQTALWMAIHAAQAGKHVLYFSLEMSIEQMLARIWSALTPVHPDHLRMDMFNTADLKILEQSRELLAALPLSLEYTASQTLEEVYTKVMLAKRMGKCDMVILDYLHMLKMPKDRNDTMSTAVGTQVNALKNLAVRAEVPILCLSQMNRNVEHRPDKAHIPEMSDLRDSGTIEQTADIVFFIYRTDKLTDKTPANLLVQPGLAHFYVAKNRNGATGFARFRFNETFSKLYNYGQALPL